MNSSILTSNKQRLQIAIQGAVQGVGFRPFIYRLALESQLTGWVNNSSQGVFIEVEGTPAQLQKFLNNIELKKPTLSIIQSIESTWLDSIGYQTFEIRESSKGEKTTLVLPDIATCRECLKEIFDPNNRRYHYPFTNCTHCGPRYTIIEALPYDRASTTMKQFQMCETCRQEYQNPLDRRFHAQPNACPKCGPHLELWNQTGQILTHHEQALKQAAQTILDGKIVAVKGLGGFHLMVDAGNSKAVQELRRRKRRSEKPFALMYPNLEAVKQDCEVSELEERLLLSPASPIVLLRQKSQRDFSAIAPGNIYLGVMLPYTPLHHLLMAELQVPIVATSGNLSDEPICIDEQEAIQRLGEIADVFLVHNRPILRPVDDSVVRIMAGREMVMRRARGYAPLPILLENLTTDEHRFTQIKSERLSSVLAVGGHLKNTVAILVNSQAFISQHIGDLETPQALNSFQEVTQSLQQLYDCKPALIVHDAHPHYQSTLLAQEMSGTKVPVQHHYAHVLAGMADNQLVAESVLGVAWDGTGYGLDSTIWGGEFLQVTPNSWQRVAHFRTFKLAGGDQAVKEPRRVALGLLYEIFGEEIFIQPNELYQELLEAFTPTELKLLQTMFQRQINTPQTSSAGRLFDGVAALMGLRRRVSFEGQAAMELEFAINEENDSQETYPFQLNHAGSTLIIDWQPLILEILKDQYQKLPTGTIAAKFHNTLAEIIVSISQQIGEPKILLTGGCFQNKYLTETTICRLQTAHFQPYWHQRIPPNDGGISLGQIIAAFKRNEQCGNGCNG
jgi:hydrogenase maturation protein HypF